MEDVDNESDIEEFHEDIDDELEEDDELECCGKSSDFSCMMQTNPLRLLRRRISTSKHEATLLTLVASNIMKENLLSISCTTSACS